MDRDFLDKLVSKNAQGSVLLEDLYIMNNNSFFSTLLEVKPYKLISAVLGGVLGYNTIFKLTTEEAKYLHEKHKINHLLGWTIR